MEFFMRNLLTKLIFTTLFFMVTAGPAAAEELVVYTSMKASLMEKLKEDFERTHPGATLNYVSSGAGKIMD